MTSLPSVDLRTVLVKEGLKLEFENQFLQMQEHMIDLEQKHADARDNIANSYMLECEKSASLQNKIERLELETNSLQEQIKEKTKKEEILIVAMTEVEVEKEEWKNKCLKRKKTIESCKADIVALKSEVRLLCSEKESMQESIERMESETKRTRRSNRGMHFGIDSSEEESSVERLVTPDITRRNTLPLIVERDNMVSASCLNPLSTSSLKAADVPYPSPPKEPATRKRRRRISSHNKNAGDGRNVSSKDDMGDRCL